MPQTIRRLIPLGPEATAWQIHGGFTALEQRGRQYFAVRQDPYRIVSFEEHVPTHCFDDPERIPLLIAAGRLQEQP